MMTDAHTETIPQLVDSQLLIDMVTKVQVMRAQVGLKADSGSRAEVYVRALTIVQLQLAALCPSLGDRFAAAVFAELIDEVAR